MRLELGILVGEGVKYESVKSVGEGVELELAKSVGVVVTSIPTTLELAQLDKRKPRMVSVMMYFVCWVFISASIPMIAIDYLGSITHYSHLFYSVQCCLTKYVWIQQDGKRIFFLSIVPHRGVWGQMHPKLVEGHLPLPPLTTNVVEFALKVLSL